MTALAWLCFAAIPLAWALTAASYRLQHHRDEADWQAMVDEAEDRAANWYAAHNLAAAGSEMWRARCADAEHGVELLVAENDRLRAEAARSLPAAPWPGEPLRDAPPEATRAGMAEFLANERALRDKYGKKKPRPVKAVK
jgi:hypothetical protein